MATRFAIATGNWSNTAIWDNGSLPASDDVIHANGFTVTLDQDITVGSLRNTISNVYLPDMPIPLMTSNILPSGVVDASSNVSTAYRAFDQTTTTGWVTGGSTLSSISYNFPTTKVIKRYRWLSDSTNRSPASWTFDGSNDGVTWTTIETVTGNTAQSYLSGATVLANTTSYTYYRINILSHVVFTNGSTFLSIEMTESVGTVYGGTNGGKYTVPNTLSGTRNITQTGDGIISNNSATVVETNNTTGNTVNFNVSGIGLILNQLNQTVTGSFSILSINGIGAVNFNGDIYGSQKLSIYNAIGTIYINSNSTVTINGNVYICKGNNPTVTSVTVNLPVSVSNSAVLNINGNIIGTNNSPNCYIFHNSTATINITGNLISDVSPCIVTGAITQFGGGNSAGSINLVGTATMTNSTSQPCIVSRNALVTITGSVTNKGNGMAISAARIRWVNTGTPFWVFQDTTGADLTLTYNTSIFNYPSTSDVRAGVTYAAFPTLTGSCIVPLPQYVSQGVPIDATVGTAYFNATDVWNVLIADITVAGSIGERLKTVATVETTGD